MNLANTLVKRTFKDEAELRALSSAIGKDEIIIPAILKLLAARLVNCKPSLTMLGDASYPYKRAGKDGAQIELEWLVELLTEDKE